MVAILPPNLNQGVIVGSSQTIQCVVIAAMRINSGSVIITWTGSHGRIISNDSRVTISPNTVTGNNYTSTLQLAYIMEDDEGTLSCHVTILNTTLSSSIEITNLTGVYMRTLYMVHFSVMGNKQSENCACYNN